MRARLLLLPLLILGMLASVTPAVAGTYDDPFFLNWPTFVPAAYQGDFEATTERDCVKGSVKCVDKVVREMTKRYNLLGCDHNAVFAFTYLRTTEQYRSAVSDPNFFQDNAFVNHQDAVFADLYFSQHDAWKQGNLDGVSPAWRIAFKAGDDQSVTGMGNLLLGMGAHVNRDLPFVLEAIGLVQPDGSTRKADHDRVNDFLNVVIQTLLTEAAAIHDASIDDGEIPGTTIDNSTVVQMLSMWREEAWRNAERLAAAPTAAARADVAQQIEDSAAFQQMGIRDSFAFNGITNGTTATRNAFCATHFVTR